MKNKNVPHYRQLTNQIIKTVTACAISLSLSACGGGSSADETFNVARASLIEPMVGTWDITGDWNGEPNDQAYLVVRTVDNDNTAEVVIYDRDDEATGLGRNCFTLSFDRGEMSESLNDRVFLDLSVFPDAVVQLNLNGDLEIQFTDTDGMRTYNAMSIGITETDIQPIC